MAASPHPLQADLARDRRRLRADVALTGLTALGLAAGVTLQIADGSARWVAAAFALAFLAGGVPAGIEALAALRRGRLDIDLLMVLAALAAAAVGEARDGAILLFLFSLAETLEDYALGNTKRAVAALMELRPDTANLRVAADGRTERVPVERLARGDVVVVRPGERVPADGRVRSGQSAVDQAPITGESVPVDKGEGDPVFSGTVNGHGVLEVEVGKLARESTLARMIDLVTEAQAQRSPSERFSDWFGQRYTVFVLLGSLTALGAFLLLGLERDLAFYKAATLLVVASPCAIVISVPAAVLSALAKAARQGVLFKGGTALEDFGRTRLIAFDKTGTLTEGRMRVTGVRAVGRSEAEVLRLAAAVEADSEHPIARSVLAYAEARGVAAPSAEDTRALPGRGLAATVEGRAAWAGNRRLAAEAGDLTSEAEAAIAAFEADGATVVVVGDDRGVAGVIGVADTVRPSARAALERLRQDGLERVAMLTGDHESVARAVAAQLGLAPEDVFAGLLPEDKVARVRALTESGEVAFVGDGVNDAAALAVASVGVAMGTAGSDVAIEAADVALLSDDLERLPQAYRLARRANRVIRQNLAFALGIMIVMVLLTLFWRLPLPLGVLGHEGGTLLVVGNGLRLLLGERQGGRGASPRTAPASAG